MKNALLSTCALACAAVLPAAALASEPIRLELGGHMYQYFGGVKTIQDGNIGGGSSGFGLDSETRIHVKGQTTLDNGLTVGASVNFRGEANINNNTENAKWQYAWIAGDFGMVNIGEYNGVVDIFAVRAPNVGERSAEDTQDWLNSAYAGSAGLRERDNRIPSMETTFDDNALRLTYMTPHWHDLSAGISYSPNSRIGGFRGQRVREGRPGSNEVQAGLALDTRIGAVGLMADTSVAFTLDGVDRWAYRSGLLLSYGGWAFGGSYLGTSASDKDRGFVPGVNAIAFEEDVFEVGLSYTVGPYGLSTTYSQNFTDLGDALSAQVAASYHLGKGVTAVGQVFYAENNGHMTYQSGKGGSTYRNGMGMITGLLFEF